MDGDPCRLGSLRGYRMAEMTVLSRRRLVLARRDVRIGEIGRVACGVPASRRQAAG